MGLRVKWLVGAFTVPLRAFDEVHGMVLCAFFVSMKKNKIKEAIMSRDLWQKFEKLAKANKKGIEDVLHHEVEALFSTLSGNQTERMADVAMYF